MAVWEMLPKNEIKYGEETVASFNLKTIANFEHLFELIKLLHSGEGFAKSSDDSSAKAGDIKLEPINNGIYIRNAANTAWVLIGYVADNFGITPEKINAVKNGGGIGTFYAGTEFEKNSKNASDFKTNDVWFATDSYRAYLWTGSAWVCFLSKNFSDMLDYEKYCVARKEVDYSGKDKILRLDRMTGKGNIDITGSPDRIFDKEIDFQNLRDGQTIVYDAAKNKWVNLPNYIFTDGNLTYTGEKSTNSVPKIVAVGKDGKIHGDFAGNTDHIGNISVKTDGIQNNWVLAYDSANNCFKPVGKITSNADELGGIKIEIDPTLINNDDVLVYDSAKNCFVTAPRDVWAGKITTTGEADKIVKVDKDGIIHGNFSGNIAQLANAKIDINNLTDGDVIVYHTSTNTFVNEPKNVITGTGLGKSLILYDREKVIGDYNGSKTVKIDISKVVSRAGTVSYVNQSMRFIENLYLAFDFNGMNFGGRDGLITEFFRGDSNNVDKTSVNVDCIVAGDDSIDVDSVEGLVIGAGYLLVEGKKSEEVKIKEIIVSGGINRIILENNIVQTFTPKVTKLCRSNAKFGKGYVTGDNVIFTTKLFKFDHDINRAHMSVKHERIPDTEIFADIATHNGTEFVKGEIIGIGNGTAQTVTLANTTYIANQEFALYFDGVKQNSGFSFSPSDGKVTFNAPNGAVVQVDYIYNFIAEDWQEMYRNLTYRDDKNSERATTQFHFAAQYKSNAGKIIAIRLKLKQNSGTVTNEIIGTGNGAPQGFKLPHHAIKKTISVSPVTATWTYKEKIDTIVINAPMSTPIQISYDWKARPFKIDSFAVILNE